MADRKKSNFVAVSVVPAGVYQDVFGNGINYRISYENYLSGLGVSGSIVQQGAVTGTPILNKQGTVNNVRNLENGFGIKASISTNNGIRLDHNFTQEATGVAIVNNLLTATPQFVSIVAGTGISAVSSDGKLTISATGSLPATKVVTVNALSDFPAASGGVITLAEGDVYVISNNITTSNRFVLENNAALISMSPLAPTLTYTGSGTMFTMTGDRNYLSNVGLTAATGKVFSVTGLSLIVISNIIISDCATIGDFIDCDNVNITNSGVFNADQGISVSNSTTGNIFSIDSLFILTTVGSGFKGVDLGTSVWDSPEFTDLTVSGPSGAVGISGAASSANVSSGNLGTVTNCNFIGAITPTSGFDAKNDIRWQATGNDGIEDTRPDSLATNTAGTTVVITTINTPVVISGTWNDQGSSKFTVNGAGRITYNGERPFTSPITASFSAAPTTGTNKDYNIAVAINGTRVAASARSARASAGDVQSVTLPWQYTFTNGDYIEFMLENNTDATDFTVSSATVRIN